MSAYEVAVADQANSGAYQSQPAMIYKPMRGSEAAQHGGQVVQESRRVTNDTNQPADEGSDCFRVVRTNKHVEIPCTRNVTRRYKVSVPKTVHEKVPRRVQYTDYESRERQEPYTVKRSETAYRDEEQSYTIEVPKKVTRMVKVTKRVPKTVYVDVVTEEPRESTIMVPETRTRKVKVPYQKEIVDKQFRKITETIPVQKYRTEYDTVSKTVYEDSWQTKVVPVTKIVRKEIPVYQVVPTGDCGNCNQVDADIAGQGVDNAAEWQQEVQGAEANEEAKLQQYTAPQIQNTNVNVPVESTGVMQQSESAPVMQQAPVMGNVDQSQMVHPSSARHASARHPSSVRAPVQAVQWVNQQGTPIGNDAMHMTSTRYDNINDPRM